ncbi:MAG TPA: hypothetical protein VGG46_05175 [Terriglobales bacterium]
MRFGVYVTIIVLVLELLLALSPFIPITAHLWHTEDQSQFYAVLASSLGIQLLLLTASITLILLKESHDAAERLSAIRAAIPGATVKPLKDYEFYSDFRNAAEEAEHSVWIAYLAPYPPSDVASRDRKKYDIEILDLMKRRTKVNFRRLIRHTEKNVPWAAELVTELKGRPNVDIAVLTCDLASDHEMPLALSVQVVDNDQVWIVATGSHQTKQNFRDVYIKDASVAAAMIQYYDRIWEKSVMVLDHGRVTDGAPALIGFSS